MALTGTIAFPDHQIDPRKKDKSWILQMARACYSNWNESMPQNSIFLAKAAGYKEIRNYATGKQSINKYKKELLPDESQDESWAKISWVPRQDGKTIRNIAVAKVQKGGYNIIATPVSQKAKDAQDKEFAKVRAKLVLRDIVQSTAPELANDPSLTKSPGDPDSLAEFEDEVKFNPKFIRARDAEESIDGIFYENDASFLWDGVAEDLVDFGVAVGKEDLDEQNKVRMRYVYPGCFACSATKDRRFSDLTWAFEIIDMKLSDLAKKFSPDEVRLIYNSVAGKNGNPHAFGTNTLETNGYDRFKAKVMDLEFISWDTRNMEANLNKEGNLKTSKAKPTKTGADFIPRTVENIYKCKWVVDTDLIFDYGLARNQKRTADPSTMAKTSLSYHAVATSFYNMRATGLTEDLIPIIDDLNMATFKLRMFRNRLIPNGYEIDLDALEDVAIGKSGENMTPKEVIDMFFETGILVSRRGGTDSISTQNYRAINPISNSMADQLASLYNDLQMSKQALRDISGLNELTDGSTPNPRMLTTIANLANESTNNALWYFINARKNLVEQMAKGVVQRLQVALKHGNYSTFNPNTGLYAEIPQSLIYFDYDIKIEDRPTDEQKQWLMELLKEDIANGTLNTPDVVTIINSNNIKTAQIILSGRAERNKKKMQEQALQNSRQTAQLQSQSNIMAEQAKVQSAEILHQMKMEQIGISKAWDYLIKSLQVGQQDNEATMKAQSEIMKTASSPQQQNSQPQQQPAQ